MCLTRVHAAQRKRRGRSLVWPCLWLEGASASVHIGFVLQAVMPAWALFWTAPTQRVAL